MLDHGVGEARQRGWEVLGLVERLLRARFAIELIATGLRMLCPGLAEARRAAQPRKAQVGGLGKPTGGSGGVALQGGLRMLAVLAVVLPVMTGCAGVNYRERSTSSQTCYATVENFGDAPITAHQVDGLLEEVAEILDITLDPAKPKVRIVVRPPSYIQAISEGVAVAGYGSQVRALYLDGANLVVIPYYSRTLLGHELAHYLTDHYLKSTPRRQWERIARTVEDALPTAAPRQVRGGPLRADAEGEDVHDDCRVPTLRHAIPGLIDAPGSPQ